ncbi:MAG: hypothetical protein DME94_00550 [Verrucomicrobia bacterium]|nr:MAG: hypothetical protein DME94_00550 [Verrucomicrobiota bacterium]
MSQMLAQACGFFTAGTHSDTHCTMFLGVAEKRREDACALPKLRETKTRFHEFRTKRFGVRCVFASLS